MKKASKRYAAECLLVNMIDLWSGEFLKLLGPPNEKGCREWLGGCNNHGYGQWFLKSQGYSAHRLAWIIANRKPIPPGLFICHEVCDNPPCCESSHLKDDTHDWNLKDAAKKGRMASGENHGLNKHPERKAWGDRNGTRTHPETRAKGEEQGQSKLKRHQVLEIRRLHLAGVFLKDIAVLFGVSRSLVGLICQGKRWAWLKDENVNPS